VWGEVFEVDVEVFKRVLETKVWQRALMKGFESWWCCAA
jgi:hypothetical protein